MFTNNVSNENGIIPKRFSLDGCQAIVDGGKKCGETQTLKIIKEFKQLYENKMREIDSQGAGDCTQAKINLQHDWIRDLTEQNEMLVRAVEELELEATERVQMLESKLQNTCQCGLEVMKKYKDIDLAFNIDKTFQKVMYLENDVKNLMEFIRRARDEGFWNSDGLQFYSINYGDLNGNHEVVEANQIKSQSTGNVKVPQSLRVCFELIEKFDDKLPNTNFTTGHPFNLV